MGNNAAYTAFESVVVKLYDLRKLDKKTLDAVAEPYRGTDIDSGGSRDLRSGRDDLSLEEIVVSVMEPKKWAAVQKLSKENTSDGGDSPYIQRLYDVFVKITDDRWGWR